MQDSKSTIVMKGMGRVRLRGKLVGQLTTKDVTSLIDDEIMESRTLDYKEQFTDDSRELLADILSFANTDGGVLIYGIAEKVENGRNTGTPASITGLPTLNLDQIRQKIENTLRDNVEPRLPSVAVQAVSVDGVEVLIIGVPRSLLAPHMSRRDYKFYARNDSQKFPMDVQQIRQAMLQTDNWERAEEYRRVRIMDYMAEKNRYMQYNPRTVFIHIVPLGSNNNLFDFRGTESQMRMFRPFAYTGWDYTYNLEGFLVWPGTPGLSYTQFFRNGGVEIATQAMFFQSGSNSHYCLAGTDLERLLVDTLHKYMTYASDLEIGPPYIAFLSLLGLKDVEITGQMLAYPYGAQGGKFEDVDILLPGITLDSVMNPQEIAFSLRGMLNMLWQAAGRTKSPHYKDDGSWGLS